jgi:hypothetical protein
MDDFIPSAAGRQAMRDAVDVEASELEIVMR